MKDRVYDPNWPFFKENGKIFFESETGEEGYYGPFDTPEEAQGAWDLHCENVAEKLPFENESGITDEE